MLTSTCGLNRGLVSNHFTELVALISLHCNHHNDELGPRDDTIVVLVMFSQHLLGIIFGGLSMSKINKNVPELAGVHGTIVVFVIAFEGLDQLGLFLRRQALLVLLRECELTCFHCTYFKIRFLR